MKLNQHKIITAQKTISSNNVVTIPFEMEVQTSSLVIEKYCMQNYDDLLFYKEFNMEQLYKLQRMKAYIKNNLSDSDYKDMINILVSKGWLVNLDTRDKRFFTFKIDDVRCKYSSDKFPFLMIYGKMTFNLNEIISEYISKDYIVVKYSGSEFIKETAEIRFIKSLPYILVFERSYDVFSVVLNIIINISKKQNSKLSNQIDKETGIKDTYKLKKQLSWNGDNNIKVVINDISGILSTRLKDNLVPLTFAGILMYQKKQKEKKKKVMQQSLDVFQKMIDVVKKMEE